MPTFINHKYKFIYFAGICCSNHSIINMFYKSDPYFFGNELVIIDKNPPLDWQIYGPNNKKRKSFVTIQWYIDNYPKIWKKYTKILLIRNPYDRMIDWWSACYHLNYSEGKISLTDFINKKKNSNIIKYITDNSGKTHIDKIIRYENREEDIKKIFIKELNIPNLERYININIHILTKKNMGLYILVNIIILIIIQTMM